MIQVCEPPRVRPVRRFSAEEFCFLLRGEAGSLYRPRSEVLRMLTVGEACGVCDAVGAPAGAVLLQPLNADTALAAALRAWAGWRGVEGGQFLTPPVLHQPDAAEPLLRAAFARAERLARGGRVLAVLFACFCILASFGIGNMSQINSIVGNMNAAFHTPYLVTGVALMVVTALIVLGGLKRVAAVTEKLVPIMALFYIVGAVVIVVLHAGNIPAAFRAIFRGAFNLQAAGGGTLGYGISQSLTWGFKRGAFSNEAGLGSAVMVNSSANVKEPVQQGMWGVFEIFADTIVVCTITALVILTTGVVDIESGSVLAGVQDNALVGQAFTAAFGSFGPKFIAISLLFFAYSTVLGWSHYGTKAVEYLFGQKGTRVYKVIFVGMVVVGATMKLGLAWDLSDTFNGLMMIPNLLAVLALSGTVVQITKNYLDRKVNGKDIPPMWSVFAEYQKAEEAEAAEEAKQAREAEALAELEILGGHAVNE